LEKKKTKFPEKEQKTVVPWFKGERRNEGSVGPKYRGIKKKCTNNKREGGIKDCFSS